MSGQSDDDGWQDAPSAEWPSVKRVLKEAGAVTGSCNEDMLGLALSVAAGAELYGKVAHLAPLAEELARQVLLFEPFANDNMRGAIFTLRAFLAVNGKRCIADDAALAAALVGPEGALAQEVQEGMRDAKA